MLEPDLLAIGAKRDCDHLIVGDKDRIIPETVSAHGRIGDATVTFAFPYLHDAIRRRESQRADELRAAFVHLGFRETRKDRGVFVGVARAGTQPARGL